MSSLADWFTKITSYKLIYLATSITLLTGLLVAEVENPVADISTDPVAVEPEQQEVVAFKRHSLAPKNSDAYILAQNRSAKLFKERPEEDVKAFLAEDTVTFISFSIEGGRPRHKHINRGEFLLDLRREDITSNELCSLLSPDWDCPQPLVGRSGGTLLAFIFVEGEWHLISMVHHVMLPCPNIDDEKWQELLTWKKELDFHWSNGDWQSGLPQKPTEDIDDTPMED